MLKLMKFRSKKGTPSQSVTKFFSHFGFTILNVCSELHLKYKTLDPAKIGISVFDSTITIVSANLANEFKGVLYSMAPDVPDIFRN